jgi:multiple antibiotic resistance protein
MHGNAGELRASEEIAHARVAARGVDVERLERIGTLAQPRGHGVESDQGSRGRHEARWCVDRGQGGGAHSTVARTTRRMPESAAIPTTPSFAMPLIADDLRQFIESMLFALATLLPIVNPLGAAPLYLAKTVDLTANEHAGLASRVAINCFLLLVSSLLIGAYVLDFFGISVPVVQVAGGLLVCSLAWSLLHQPDEPLEWVQDAATPVKRPDLRTRAFYPLTMPLIVGPGSISVAITLGANQSHALRPLVVNTLGHVVGASLVALTIFVTLRYAEPILRRFGPTGTAVILRLSAFILLCIGVQIVWNGASALWQAFR